ncbi:MAG: hypothetical protein JW749_11425 [Sedimentisphaerales bacterium]|nr:hypothetical protein [Sedimentisphaerales bacterium]
MRQVYRAIIALVLTAGCVSAGGNCPRFQAGNKTGKIELKRINEASGMAASRKNSDVLWVHNDDGPPCVYALTPQGKHLGIYNLAGVFMYDWEDIAIGPGPDPNTDYLYIGAIGDNNSSRKSVTVFRVAEPNVDSNQPAVITAVKGVERLDLVYPDGPRNAEVLMIDPLTKDIYIISKEETGRIYRAAYPQATTGKTKMEYVAKLPWGTATGGDVSADGKMIIVRNYFGASAWVRKKDEPLWKSFEGDECKIPLILESQGEAICFDANGTGYYTTSEKRHQPIYYFPMDQQKKI